MLASKPLLVTPASPGGDAEARRARELVLDTQRMLEAGNENASATPTMAAAITPSLSMVPAPVADLCDMCTDGCASTTVLSLSL